MKIRFTKNSVTDLKKLDPKIRERIKRKLIWFLAQSDPLVFAKPLIHSSIGTFRFRIGDYRVVFDAEKDDIIVLAVGHRGEIYE